MSRKLTRVAVLGVVVCSMLAFGMPVARVHAAPSGVGAGRPLPPGAVVYRATISHTPDPAFLKAHPEFTPRPLSSVGIGPDLIQPPPGSGGTWICNSSLVMWRETFNPTTLVIGLGTEECNVGMTSGVSIIGNPCVPLLFGCVWGGITGMDQQFLWPIATSQTVVNPPDVTVYFPSTGNLNWRRSPQFFLPPGTQWRYEADMSISPNWPDGRHDWVGNLPFCRVNSFDDCTGP